MMQWPSEGTKFFTKHLFNEKSVNQIRKCATQNNFFRQKGRHFRRVASQFITANHRCHPRPSRL